jgi:phosphohistidine phosphatase
MYIYFLRHASAGDRKPDPKKDERRPLDAEGVLQCGYVGRALAALQTHVDVIVSSPLKRATQTATLVANELDFEAPIELSAALRPEAAYPAFRELVAHYSGQEAILVVGHNPNLSEFLGRLIGGGSRAGVDLKKSGVARVEVNHQRGVLNWCLTPKLLRTLYASSTSSSRPNTPRK